MKRQPKARDESNPEFTAGEHMHVQSAIEERARKIWIQNGSRPNASLDNWLQAEHEVIKEFINTRSNRA